MENQPKILLSRSKKSTELQRQLLIDFQCLFNTELESKCSYGEVKELTEMSGCDVAVFAEKKRNLKLYFVSKKTVEFEIINIITMKTLQTETNCFKNSGILVTFTKEFEEDDNLKKVKESFENFFVNSEKDVEKMLSFYYVDDKIVLRVFKIGENKKLDEIGPRLTLKLNKIY